MVITCSTRCVLMWSMIAARVVDFPLPVVPVTKTIPRRSLEIFSTTNGRFKSEMDLISVGIILSTSPTAPRC